MQCPFRPRYEMISTPYRQKYSLPQILVRAIGDSVTASLHYLEAWLNDLVKVSPYLRELIGKPGKDRNGTEGDDTEIELPTKFVRCRISNAAENGVAMHLSKNPDKAQGKDCQQDGEAPVDEGMRLKGVGIPGDKR